MQKGIKTKFNLGDIVYFIYEGDLKCGIITEIEGRSKIYVNDTRHDPKLGLCTEELPTRIGTIYCSQVINRYNYYYVTFIEEGRLREECCHLKEEELHEDYESIKKYLLAALNSDPIKKYAN